MFFSVSSLLKNNFSLVFAFACISYEALTPLCFILGRSEGCVTLEVCLMSRKIKVTSPSKAKNREAYLPYYKIFGFPYLRVSDLSHSPTHMQGSILPDYALCSFRFPWRKTPDSQIQIRTFILPQYFFFTELIICYFIFISVWEKLSWLPCLLSFLGWINSGNMCFLSGTLTYSQCQA